MEKKTLYALIALVVLVAIAIVAMRTPEKGDRVGDKPRPMPEIKSGTIATLELTQPPGSEKVTITKKGDKWQVVSPFDRPADQSSVKAAVEALERLKWGDITTQQKGRHAEFEVSDDKAVHVLAKDAAGKTLADLYLGKSVGAATLARIAGKDDVWQLLDLYTSTFKRDAKSWREHAVFDLTADDATKVTIRGGGQQVVLERLPAPSGPDGKAGSTNIYDAKWKIVEGGGNALKPGIEIDNGLLNRMVQSMASLRAADFLDSGKPEQFGLNPGSQGQIEVQVAFKDNKTAGVRIGNLKGEDYYAQTLDSPQIFTVKKFGLEPVAHLPVDIRDKTLVTMKGEQIDQVTVAQGKDVVALKQQADKSWKADKLADADDAKVKAVAESFDNLSGSGFVATDAPELASLSKPKAVVTIKPKSGAPTVIKIGDARGEDVAVQKAGQDAMWLKKYQVDRFLKKPSELTKEKK